jgi:hypothetical protein
MQKFQLKQYLIVAVLFIAVACVNTKQRPLYHAHRGIDDTTFKFNKKVVISLVKVGADEWVSHVDSFKYQGAFFSVRVRDGKMIVPTLDTFTVIKRWRSKLNSNWLHYEVSDSITKGIRCTLIEDFFFMEFPQQAGKSKTVIFDVIQKQGGFSDRKYFKS